MGWRPKNLNDPFAIHDNIAGEIAALSLVTAADSDHVLIEDASDSNNKKRVAVSDFTGGAAGVPDWEDFTPTWTASTTNPSIGNGTLVGRYRQNTNAVMGRVVMVAGSTTTFGSGFWRFLAPVEPLVANESIHYGVGVWYGENSAVQGYNGTTRVRWISSVANLEPGYTTSNGAFSLLTATAPFSWGVGDWVALNFFYEVSDA